MTGSRCRTCPTLLKAAPRWVSEPVCDWLTGASDPVALYEYRVGGTLAGGDIQIDRIDRADRLR